MPESKDRSGSGPSKTFDEAWESLPESSESSESIEEGTRPWTEEVRGARKRDAERRSEDDAEPAEPVRTEETMAWTEEVRAARKRDAPPADDADEMDRMMQSTVDAAPPEDEEVPASVSASAMSFDAPDVPEPKPDASTMDALMSAEVPDESDDDEPLPPPIVLHPNRKLEESDDSEPAQAVARPAAARRSGKKNRLPLVVGGAVAAALALWFSREPPKPRPSTPAERVPAQSPEPNEVRAPTPDPEPPPLAPKLDVPPPSPQPEPEREPPQVDPDRDPREPPEGTPPEIAEVFSRLPVSPADRAPVGGVGRTGIHVDSVAMGHGYERNRCTGGDGPFSVSKDDRANVCLRVVHQREKEELSVVWQKVEGNARRGKIMIKPMHAYRTRAYLTLRREYVGEWEVKIYSDDGVELARYPFTVVP